FDVELAEARVTREVVARAEAVVGRALGEERDDVDVARGPAAVVGRIARLREARLALVVDVGALPEGARIDVGAADPRVVEVADRHRAALVRDEGHRDVGQSGTLRRRTSAQVVAQVVPEAGVDEDRKSVVYGKRGRGGGR